MIMLSFSVCLVVLWLLNGQFCCKVIFLCYLQPSFNGPRNDNLHWVVIILETECDVVVMFVGVGTLRDLANVILIWNILLEMMVRRW